LLHLFLISKTAVLLLCKMDSKYLILFMVLIFIIIIIIIIVIIITYNNIFKSGDVSL